MESWDVPAQGARICEANRGAAGRNSRHRALAGRVLGRHRLSRPIALAPASRARRRCSDWPTLSCAPRSRGGARSRSACESGRAFGPDTVANVHDVVSHLSGAEVEFGRGAGRSHCATHPPDAQTLARTLRRPHRRAQRRARALASRRADLVKRPQRSSRSPRRRARLGDRVPHLRCRRDRRSRTSKTRPSIRSRALGVEHARTTRAPRRQLRARIPALYAALRQVVAARAEWFDGTGKPNGHARGGSSDRRLRFLRAAIAYDRLDRSERHRYGRRYAIRPARRSRNDGGWRRRAHDRTSRTHAPHLAVAPSRDPARTRLQERGRPVYGLADPPQLSQTPRHRRARRRPARMVRARRRRHRSSTT